MVTLPTDPGDRPGRSRSPRDEPLLFDEKEPSEERTGPVPPLADRMRPTTLDQVIGQEHLTGEGAPLRRFMESGEIPSILFWGPPGSGKTTLARILSRHAGYDWEQFSAVLSGVKDVRAAVERARYRREAQGKRTILFVDEIHRFNKAQQDAFLPHVESGTITLLGATTENPSFEVNSALLSRCRVYVLRNLDEAGLRRIGETAIDRLVDSGESERFELEPDAWSLALLHGDGDARKMINLIEIVAQSRSAVQESGGDADSPVESVSREQMENLLQRRLARNLGGEDHFDWISALHKAIRGSDPHAALYWLARMLEAGEDPKYVARRLVRAASEDIGLAEPGALAQTLAAKGAVEFLGFPECNTALAQAVVYLSLAPKSNSVYEAYARAADLVRERGALPVPMRIRNAPTRLMKDLGYGADYRYPHAAAGHWVPESYLPEEIDGEAVYRPSEQGREPRMIEDHKRRTGGFYRLEAEPRSRRPDPSGAASPEKEPESPKPEEGQERADGPAPAERQERTDRRDRPGRRRKES